MKNKDPHTFKFRVIKFDRILSRDVRVKIKFVGREGLNALFANMEKFIIRISSGSYLYVTSFPVTVTKDVHVLTYEKTFKSGLYQGDHVYTDAQGRKVWICSYQMKVLFGNPRPKLYFTPKKPH